MRKRKTEIKTDEVRLTLIVRVRDGEVWGASIESNDAMHPMEVACFTNQVAIRTRGSWDRHLAALEDAIRATGIEITDKTWSSQ